MSKTVNSAKAFNVDRNSITSTSRTALSQTNSPSFQLDPLTQINGSDVLLQQDLADASGTDCTTKILSHRITRLSSFSSLSTNSGSLSLRLGFQLSQSAISLCCRTAVFGDDPFMWECDVSSWLSRALSYHISSSTITNPDEASGKVETPFSDALGSSSACTRGINHLSLSNGEVQPFSACAEDSCLLCIESQSPYISSNHSIITIKTDDLSSTCGVNTNYSSKPNSEAQSSKTEIQWKLKPSATEHEASKATYLTNERCGNGISKEHSSSSSSTECKDLLKCPPCSTGHSKENQEKEDSSSTLSTERGTPTPSSKESQHLDKRSAVPLERDTPSSQHEEHNPSAISLDRNTPTSQLGEHNTPANSLERNTPTSQLEEHNTPANSLERNTPTSQLEEHNTPANSLERNTSTSKESQHVDTCSSAISLERDKPTSQNNQHVDNKPSTVPLERDTPNSKESQRVDNRYFAVSFERDSPICKESPLVGNRSFATSLERDAVGVSSVKATGAASLSSTTVSEKWNMDPDRNESQTTEQTKLSDQSVKTSESASSCSLAGLCVERTSECSMELSFGDLPREVLLKLAQYVPTVSLIACMEVHYAFSDLLSDAGFLNRHTRLVLGFPASQRDITYNTVPAPVEPVQELWYQAYLQQVAPYLVGVVRPGVVFYNVLCFKHLLDTWLLQGKGYKYWMFVSDIMKSAQPPLNFLRCKRLITISRRMVHLLTKLALCNPSILLATINDFEQFDISQMPPSELDDAWEHGIPPEWKIENLQETCELVSRQRGLNLASFFLGFDSKCLFGWSGIIDYSTFRFKDSWGLYKCAAASVSMEECREISHELFPRFLAHTGMQYINLHCTSAFFFRSLNKLIMQRSVLMPKMQEALEKTALRIHSKLKKALPAEKFAELKLFLDRARFIGSTTDGDTHMSEAGNQRKLTQRELSKTMEVAVQRYLHRYVNSLVGKQVLQLYTDPVCHHVLCITCRNTHTINVTPFSVCMERVGPQCLPLKIWPPHLLHHALLSMPALAKLVRLDVELWKRDTLGQPLSPKVEMFIRQTLDAVFLDFSINRERKGIIVQRLTSADFAPTSTSPAEPSDTCSGSEHVFSSKATDSFNSDPQTLCGWHVADCVESTKNLHKHCSLHSVYPCSSKQSKSHHELHGEFGHSCSSEGHVQDTTVSKTHFSSSDHDTVLTSSSELLDEDEQQKKSPHKPPSTCNSL